MLNKQNVTTVFFVWLALSACGTAQIPVSPATPSGIPSSSPTASATVTSTVTVTPLPLETATITPTATPLPICTPGESIGSAANGSLPGYIDILNVSTKLQGSNLTVIFTMSWLPEQIMIDRNILGYGSAEIAWGVAIDVDNEPSTGSSIALTNSGYGYEYALQTINIKQGEERQGDIQSLFSDQTRVWEYYLDGSSGISDPGKLKVSIDTATLTLSGNIKGITRESYLHFFAVYFPTATQQMADELCQR